MILGTQTPRIKVFIRDERQKSNQKLMAARRERIAVCVSLQSRGRSPQLCSWARPTRAVRNYAPCDSDVKPHRRARILPTRDKIVGEAR
jgi:hypothetical protein